MILLANHSGTGRFRARLVVITAVITTSVALAAAVALGATPAQAAPKGAPGADLPTGQTKIDWSAVTGAGISFVGMMATEGTSYVDPAFAGNFAAAHQAGLVRGAYHLALPNVSSGAAQADFFLTHGGDWSAHNATLPPTLDIEYNPYGSTCYGLTQAAMIDWIVAFSDEVRARIGRYPMLFTTAGWWRVCTGGSSAVAGTDPLWAGGWSAGADPGLPPGFTDYALWQYGSGTVPGVPGGGTGLDVFHGTRDQLLDFANNA